MYRLLSIILGAVLITGCGSLKTSDFLSRTGDALSKIGQKSHTVVGLDHEINPLFEQPYIDPLTEYLQRYAGDPKRAAQLGQVRQERERRCAAVARRYNMDGISETGLALYRRGYSFSCPQDVAAYEARLEALQQASAPARQSGDESLNKAKAVRADEMVGSAPKAKNTESNSANEAEKVAKTHQLNNCYLLTQIRNFSGALNACRGPAEAGAAGAQVRMAQIQKALGNHESAYRWARQAAPESAEAANLLGEMYAKGLGVAQDKAEAANWFRTAAGLGHAGAQNTLDNLASDSAGDNVN